jgi:hypothetical protein
VAGNGRQTSDESAPETPPPKLAARCPVTGDDVFPSAAEAMTVTVASIVLICPSCRRQHRWSPLSGQLTDLS